MDLRELAEWKRNWQKKHVKEVVEFARKNPDGYLSYLTIALCGETGEFANIVKKINRQRIMSAPPEDHDEKLKEELVDIFIYTLLLADRLNVDLEKATLEKHRRLEEKFKKMK